MTTKTNILDSSNPAIPSLRMLESYEVGDIGPAGGWIFYKTSSGTYYECASTDQSTSQAWSNITDTVITGTGTAIGTGKNNTDLIINQVGHTDSAAKLCKDYSVNGYSDWFLPSKDELDLMWTNLYSLDIGNFTGIDYWSSSENIATNQGWAEYFVIRDKFSANKYVTNYVRACRSFTVSGEQLRQDIVSYLSPIHKRNVNTEANACIFSPGISIPTAVGGGTVYSPTQNRIYLVPGGEGPGEYWYYIDCNTGEFIAYTNVHYGTSTGAVTAFGGVFGSYFGGVYSPTQNRIYFVPYAQSGEDYWHYVNCNTGEVCAYAHNTSAIYTYQGGVYSPTQNRIYFVPFDQADETYWQYIDCTSTGAAIDYTPNIDKETGTHFGGGVYSPTQNRIYLVPTYDPDQTYWYYIDCNVTTSTGQVMAYQNNSGQDILINAYVGGAYSPTQNRIYFVPAAQGSQDYWHYIDCNTGDVIAYPNNSGVTPITPEASAAYFGGVYSPTQNRIYFVPYSQVTETFWHYIDCNTGNVIAYEHHSAIALPAMGGVYSPTQNRIYPAIVYIEATDRYYIQEFSNEKVSRQLMSGTLFNKF
jgi:hypothetical protein